MNTVNQRKLESCGLCRFWDQTPDEDGHDIGICRRFPPTYEEWAMSEGSAADRTIQASPQQGDRLKPGVSRPNEGGARLLFLPPYSPDLNPIEHDVMAWTAPAQA
jgi:hypothetical protein